ncbi:MAG: LacI family DNA-binding transcriptional regulator [Microbacteriaceae bacterium]
MSSSPARPMRKQPTIYDVAQHAGVSKSVVSRVLQNDASVSVVRRQAVEEAIEALQYRPSRHAQNLAAGRTRTIGVIVAEYDNLSYINALAGMREVFDEANYQVIINDLHRGGGLDDPVLAFAAMSVEALVFIAEPGGLKTDALNVPAVMIGERASRIPNADEIASDDEIGSRLALDHLWSLGHRKIAHLTGIGGIAGNRLRAYENFMTEHGEAVMSFGQGQPTTSEGGYAGAKELLASGTEFTAVYAANDSMAAGATSAFAESKIFVPADISMVGYDNSPLSSEHMLKLTTVDDRGYDVGKLTAQRILQVLESNEPLPPISQLLEPTLVVRSSSQPLRP